jgi:translation initiation factor RLI1
MTAAATAATKKKATAPPRSCKIIDRRCASYAVKIINQIPDTMMANFPKRYINSSTQLWRRLVMVSTKTGKVLGANLKMLMLDVSVVAATRHLT